jgi:hypothetical protein
MASTLPVAISIKTSGPRISGGGAVSGFHIPVSGCLSTALTMTRSFSWKKAEGFLLPAIQELAEPGRKPVSLPMEKKVPGRSGSSEKPVTSAAGSWFGRSGLRASLSRLLLQ